MVTRPCAAGTQLAAPEETVSLNEMLSPVAAVALGATPRNPVAIARETANIACFMKISPYYLVFWIQILAFVVMEGLSIFRILEVLGSMFEFALALLRQLQPTLCQLMSPFRRDPLRGAPTLKAGRFGTGPNSRGSSVPGEVLT